jgi:hypothetical protein
MAILKALPLGELLEFKTQGYRRVTTTCVYLAPPLTNITYSAYYTVSV